MSGSEARAENYDVKAGLETVEAFDVCGLSAVISNEDDQAVDQINMLWQRFFSESVAMKVPERKNDVIYAVYSEYQGDHTKPYRLTIGYKLREDEVEAAAAGIEDFRQVRVKGGEYAGLSAQGQQPQALIETWTAVWESDLDRKFETDFELYGPRFFEDGVHEVLVYIGLKDKH